MTYKHFNCIFSKTQLIINDATKFAETQVEYPD